MLTKTCVDLVINTCKVALVDDVVYE